MFKLNTELCKISGIGEKFLKRLEKLEIKTVKDLLWHFPFRYDDFSKVVKIRDLKINQTATVRGMVQKVGLRKTWKKKILLVEALIVDETGGIKAIWFNQPYVVQLLRPGRWVNFAGKVTMSEEEVYLSNPAYELLNAGGETKHTAGLIPVYSETKGLTSKGLRYLIKPLLHNLDPVADFIPEEILEKNNLPELNLALRRIHFPRIIDQAEQSRRRFAFEDLFLLQLNNIKTRLKLAKEKAPVLEVLPDQLNNWIQNLPFELTGSQKKSLEEITDDLSRGRPMNRLLQGDVGSGKTVLAALAAFTAAANDCQTAFMAPTEVLARQHYRTLVNLFGKMNAPIGLLTSAEARVFFGDRLENKISKSCFLKEIADNKIKIIIGTHALIQKNVKFPSLALVIVDEQHRFGVQQRAELTARESAIPHFLSMSATPIPRTLSLALFGDLDLSLIDELPKGRKPIITKIVAPQNRQKAYDFVRGQIKNGRQAFVICPRIEPKNSDANYLQWDVKAVKEEFERLSKKVFPDLRLAMLHGRLKSKEKEEVMTKFANGEIDIMVSTSVIEVGIDVPNAAIMIIEGADRFGLAQLYQFRGRIGRGSHQSFCLLFTDSESPAVQQRLRALKDAKNGFKLAEVDLKMRGPGQFLGEKQTGIPDLAMRALNNLELVKSARAAAVEILEQDQEFQNYPLIKAKLSEFSKTLHLE
jgi:ATP-dependent DNA helicase RecG